MPVTEKTYEQVALEDPDGQWELFCGKLRSKPPMTHAHNILGYELSIMIREQVNRREYETKFNAPRTRVSAGNSFIPDVLVVPRRFTEHLRRRSDALESYPAPLPFVAEVWSPSTGEYDVDTKLPGYRDRGDLEVWRIQPYERTVTRWVRRDDGGYSESLHTSGAIRLAALPNVTIDLDELFSLME
ncbi:MAG: Uma2 family endonuclease [Dehalococcoidia bacterium]